LVFERYYRELLSFLARKVSDRQVAADLTQESYARVYAAQAAGTHVHDPRALLYQTARNLVIDHHRHGDVRAGVEVSAEHADGMDAHGSRNWEPETAASSQQAVVSLVTAIDNLPPRCREAFMLNRFDGMTYAEVAERMGISVKAVEQHIKHALDACERSRAQTAGHGQVLEVLAGGRKKLHRSRHD
jgi:RNA polymerase sigma factor (sigma-70 family)